MPAEAEAYFERPAADPGALAAAAPSLDEQLKRCRVLLG